MDLKSPSKLKMSPAKFSKYKWIVNMTVIVVVTFVISRGAILAFKSRVSNAPTELYYTVVVDCGSTGTRIDVYEWTSGVRSGSNLPVLLQSYPNNATKSPLRKKSCSYHCMQTQPGLDKFVGNISGVKASLKPLIEWAEQEIPAERRAVSPIFVLSTAGIRRLANEDANQVLEDIEAVLKEHSFLYRKNWIRVLSGSEEAYYGWVALNYKMGSFRNSSRSGTLGILDLGGSSLQVVIESDSKREEREEMHFIRSRVGSVEHQVLAFSWAAFGLNEAFDRTLLLLNQTQQLGERDMTTVELRHPCLSSGFMQNYTCYNCVSHNLFKEKLSHEIRKTGVPFYLVGNPDWEQCKLIARAAAINSSTLAWSEPLDATKCLASLSFSNGGNNTVVAIPTTRFHALSGFFAVYHSLNLSTRANWTNIWKRGLELCSSSQADMLGSISGNQSSLWQYCFHLPYVASLIEDALCLGGKEVIFGPPDVSWTLGAALIEGEYLWSSSSTTTTAENHNSTLGNIEPVYVFLLLLCLLLVVYYNQIKLPMLGRKAAAAGAALPSYVLPKHRPN